MLIIFLEAELFADFINKKYGIKVDLLELKSINCGNNITYCLDMLKENNVYFNSIIIVQDSTIQKRMDAGFKKYIAEDVSTMNFISYDVNAVNKNEHLRYYKDILRMWEMNRYMTLLTGDISRLIDDENIYK